MYGEEESCSGELKIFWSKDWGTAARGKATTYFNQDYAGGGVMLHQWRVQDRNKMSWKLEYYYCTYCIYFLSFSLHTHTHIYVYIIMSSCVVSVLWLFGGMASSLLTPECIIAVGKPCSDHRFIFHKCF